LGAVLLIMKSGLFQTQVGSAGVVALGAGSAGSRDEEDGTFWMSFLYHVWLCLAVVAVLAEIKIDFASSSWKWVPASGIALATLATLFDARWKVSILVFLGNVALLSSLQRPGESVLFFLPACMAMTGAVLGLLAPAAWRILVGSLFGIASGLGLILVQSGFRSEDPVVLAATGIALIPAWRVFWDFQFSPKRFYSQVPSQFSSGRYGPVAGILGLASLPPIWAAFSRGNWIDWSAPVETLSVLGSSAVCAALIRRIRANDRVAHALLRWNAPLAKVTVAVSGRWNLAEERIQKSAWELFWERGFLSALRWASARFRDLERLQALISSRLVLRLVRFGSGFADLYHERDVGFHGLAGFFVLVALFAYGAFVLVSGVFT
jgi:hypothetical protein